mmetsp:Transcript_4090/g.3944  ORF Transcript_4090/g.3944 Transcript_4090/m.3944 type:complete len:487 (+) Transcript_4090:158-1618(+)
MDDMPFSDLLELRLSFQNILKIQNLRGLTSLKKLCLDNNIITKIEGLTEDLVNLEWLDLSFNNIKVVEGLEELINLTDLSLFHNQITEVRAPSLDSCKKLNVISLGDNMITSYEAVIPYLRTFPNLQVLKLEGNKICEDSGYKSYVIAFISQLKYLDYVLLEPQEIQRAKEDHRGEDLGVKDAQAQQEEVERELIEKAKKELDDAFIGGTHKFLEHLKEEFEDEEKKICVLPEQDNQYAEFAEKVNARIQDFQKTIIEKNETRLQIIDKFKRSVQKAEDEVENEAIKLIGNYEKEEKQSMRIFEQDVETDEDLLRDLIPKIDDLEDLLIEKELSLVERLNEAIERFDKKMKDIVSEIKEDTKNFSEAIIGLMDLYFGELQKIKDEQIKLFYAENVNMDNFTPEQKEVYQDREGLLSALTNLQDDYKEQIGTVEDEITKAYDGEMEKFIEEFKYEKHERNRTRIREIMELSQEKREIIEKTLSEDIS